MDPNSPTSSGLAAEIAKEPKESKVIIDTLDLSKYDTNRFWWFWRTWKANIIFLILIAGVIFLIYLLEELIRTNKCSADKTKASLYVIGILASSVAIYQLIWPHTKLWAVTSKSTKMSGWAAFAHRQKIDKKLADIKEKARLAAAEVANKPQEPPKPTYSYSDPNYYKQQQQFQPLPQRQSYQQPLPQRQSYQQPLPQRQPQLQPQYQEQPQQQFRLAPPQQNLSQVNNRDKILAERQQHRDEQYKRTQMGPVFNELSQSEQYKRRQNSAVIAPMSLAPLNTQPSKAAFVAEGLASIYEKNQETQPMLAQQPVEQSNESSWPSWLSTGWFDSKNGLFGADPQDEQEERERQRQPPQVESLNNVNQGWSL